MTRAAGRSQPRFKTPARLCWCVVSMQVRYRWPYHQDDVRRIEGVAVQIPLPWSAGGRCCLLHSRCCVRLYWCVVPIQVRYVWAHHKDDVRRIEGAEVQIPWSWSAWSGCCLQYVPHIKVQSGNFEFNLSHTPCLYVIQIQMYWCAGSWCCL